MIIEFFKQTFSCLSRVIAFLAGCIYASLEPTFPFILVCLFAIILDCLTAWRLARRVRQKHGRNDGKFKSEHAKRIFSTFLIICMVVFLCHLIDTEILYFADLHLANIISGAFCFVQLLSILENESSLNDSSWAKACQKILINKANRHFDIDLSQITKDNNE